MGSDESPQEAELTEYEREQREAAKKLPKPKDGVKVEWLTE